MKAIILVLSLFSFGFHTYSQDVQFEEWDGDGDDKLKQTEFTENFKDAYFNEWDVSQTKGILAKGFFEKTYTGLDTDGDRVLSDQEWLIGYNYFLNDYAMYGDISSLDSNDDGKISFGEYYSAMSDTDLFSAIDVNADTFISEDELANYVFNNWDIDDNGVISEKEFGKFDRYYLDV